MVIPDVDIPSIPNTPEVGMQLSAGPAHPVMLLPVRLETRFFTKAEGSFELRVRVYPDTVHMDTHEPELTADELTWGQHFWEQTWRAVNDIEREKAAWRQLADRFDPPRAAWITHALKPLNPEDRPATPVIPDQPLPKPPRFPSPAIKAGAWTRAPQTRVLPTFWVVLGYKNGQLVMNVKGNAIPAILATGPDPRVNAANTSINADQLAIDDGMKWMVDFDAAEKVGMGIRITLAKEVALAGLDFVLVLGIKDAPGGASDRAAQVAELFDAHHYTSGMSFVAPGTASNNTTEAPSGFSSKDPGHEASYLAEHAAAFQVGDESNADVLSAAFGLMNAPGVFANLPNAMAKDQQNARNINTALWQATWGYFLLQMLGVGGTNESPLTDDDIAWVRRHFIDYIRANGPLPAVRIGKQPYGILPVTSLNAWQPPNDQQSQYTRDVALRDFMIRLRDIWRRNYLKIPRLGRSDNVDKDLAHVLSMEGLSSNYSIHSVLGRHYLEHLWVFLSAEFFFGLPMSWQPQPRIPFTFAQFRSWFAKQEELNGMVLQTLGINWRPRLAHAGFGPPRARLKGALVEADQSIPSFNYIGLLLAARDLETIHNETIEEPPRVLLYRLLRHSMLLEYADAGFRLLVQRGLLQSELRREPELVNLKADQRTQTVWDQMNTKITVTGMAEPITVGKYLLDFTPTGEPDIGREPGLKTLSDFRASLTHLKTLDATRLEQLMTGTLDLCSHRLDAWITSFATKRLAEMRKEDPTGMLFGGYGWVMNLKPAESLTKTTTPSGEQDPVFQPRNNPGFIHTPSLTQAATAAVLRSGHLSHAGNEKPDDLLAIDLSSERVRLATWLVDGVRQGQPLGALMGYRFERRLQEAGKAQFIAFFRELAPLVAKKREESNEAVENIAANNVVDGLGLNSKWLALLKNPPPSDGSGYLPILFGSLSSEPTAGDLANARAVLEAELNSLADSTDAVSDALIAESVYQTVRGNPLRTAGTLESIAGGETPPPELEVVRTPRTGIASTHRLVTVMSGEPTLPAGWQAPSANQFRAFAEPHLNAWAAKLLGNLINVRCVVERLEAGTGKVLESKELRLNQLPLAPLDFIYAIEGGQQAEIEQHILYTIMRSADGFAPGSLLRVNPDRKPEWEAGDLGYGEFNEALRMSRRLITSARVINAADLSSLEQNTNFSVDIVELENRALAAEQKLGETSTDLKGLLAAPDSADLEALRGLIIRGGSFAVTGAIPLSVAGDFPSDRQILLTQAASILNELMQRAAQLETLDSGFNAGTAIAEDRRDHALAQLRIIFGKAFMILPRFTATNAAELEKALADSAKVLDGDLLAPTTWFQRMARVREGVSRLNTVVNYSEALNTGEKLQLTIAQLPYSANDRWIGLPLKAGQTQPGGKLSLAVQSSVSLDMHQQLVGLLIDEWVEVVPSATETTGIALQYDQPNAAPPQSILIAVPPEIDSPWTVWSLQQVLIETLDLARIRAVDPDALGEVGHYLPALYFAYNTIGDTVSTDFTK